MAQQINWVEMVSRFVLYTFAAIVIGIFGYWATKNDTQAQELEAVKEKQATEFKEAYYRIACLDRDKINRDEMERQLKELETRITQHVDKSESRIMDRINKLDEKISR